MGRARKWLGNHETPFPTQGSVNVGPQVIVMHRRYEGHGGKVHHHGWLRFSPSMGTVEGVRNLRRLAHAILRSIGDEVPRRAGSTRGTR